MTTTMSNSGTMPADRQDGRPAGHRVEGSSSLARIFGEIIRKPVMQAGLVGVLLACGLVWVCGAIGISISTSQLAIISAAGALAFWCLRDVLGVSFWVALPCSLVWLGHPLMAGSIKDGSAGGPLLAMLVVPLILVAACAMGRGASIRTAVLFGVAVGATLAIIGRGSLVLVAMAIVLAVYEAFAGAGAQRLRGHWRALAIRLLLAAIVATSVAVALPGIASGLGAPLPALVTTAADTGGVTAPFAWVDRAGLLASQLTVLPEDLRAGGGSFYLGGAILVLGLIAVWPKTADERCRRAALSIVLAFIALWLLRGSESLHAQLARMFEFATLKRHVEPASLQMLGFMIIPLAMLPLTLFLAIGELMRSGRRWTVVSVIMATAAVMLWWATSPGDVLAKSVLPSMSLLDTSLLRVLTAFLMVCGAAVGFQRLLAITSTRPRRLLAWLIVLALIAVDVQPYWRAVIDRHSSVRPQSDSQGVTQESAG